MKGIVLLLFMVGFSLGGIPQTQSDSLYFAKLYPLEDGEFMVIGSEVPGSFRKTVIRLYGSDLKMKKQIYDKNMRNSEIFLDEVYPESWRVISRYRWNKGRVMIYGKDLGLEAVSFFKRELYKDWKDTEDESAEYPMRGNEKLKGLDPLFHKDSFCYFFSKETKTVFISTYNSSVLKPVYLPKSSHKIKDYGAVVNYKFRLTESGRVLFYYCLDHQNSKNNYFTFLDEVEKDTDFAGYDLNGTEAKYSYHISDINYDDFRKMIYFGGSFSDKKVTVHKGENPKNKQGMQGYFMRAYFVNEEEREMTLDVDFSESVAKEDSSNVVGYKLAEIGIEENHLFGVFEKFLMNEKKVNLNDGMELSGTYFTYTSMTMKVVYKNFVNNVIHQYDIPLKYNLTDEKYFQDKQWRTFHDLKGQNIQHLIFNGKVNYGYNDMSVVSTDWRNRKIVYADRNYNYYLCDWKDGEQVYSVLYKNTEKARCYFFDDYFVKFITTDWGFKLEKVSY